MKRSCAQSTPVFRSEMVGSLCLSWATASRSAWGQALDQAIKRVYGQSSHVQERRKGKRNSESVAADRQQSEVEAGGGERRGTNEGEG